MGVFKCQGHWVIVCHIVPIFTSIFISIFPIYMSTFSVYLILKRLVLICLKWLNTQYIWILTRDSSIKLAVCPLDFRGICLYTSSKYFESILSYLIIIKWNNKWPFYQINVQHVFISPLPSQLRSCDIEKFLVLSSIHTTLY